MCCFSRLLLQISLLVCFGLSSGSLFAVTLNSGGGTDASNGLRIYIDKTGQLQVLRVNKGQLYRQTDTPPDDYLLNGVFVRAGGTTYGPRNYKYPSIGIPAPTAFSSTSESGPTPATSSQGAIQTAATSFKAGSSALSPKVAINWKYTYPLDYVTAEVTITISDPTVSNNNPVRYYHMVDTYLGGNDCGCGVTFPADKTRPQTVGTYPWSGSCKSGDTTSSVSCPSSTGLPANLDVVESFRERSGKFSAYCVGSWSSFWTNSNSEACSLLRSDPLGKTVNTKLIDTGVAIEYDFTAVGIYTFSYDFVVGSTYVPAYDHIEIRHPGTASLCPVNVQVMACLTSAVPCPDNQLVTSGVLLGDLVVSPSLPAVTKTPNEQFNIGSEGTTESFALQAGSAGTSVLGASGMTTPPLSGVRCWNTTTNSQSCNLTFTNTPCVSTFECIENTLTYQNRTTDSALRNPLYTKVMGAPFDVDVVALLANGTQSTGYNSTSGLTVQLVNDNGGTCGTTVVATKNVTFSAVDAGRKKVTFDISDISRPHPNLRCKVTDTALTKTGCSSDNFAIRPSSLSVTNVNPLQSTPSHTSAPVRRAGTDKFGVTVSINESTYTGTPKVDSTKLETHTNVTSVGLVNGTFNPAVSGVSVGSDFTYSEVGHFKFKAQGIYDDTYAAVDIATGDCDNSFDSLGSGIPKRFGCKFGNTVASDYIGRFIPDHFKVTAGTTYTDGCGSFTYYDQDPGLVTPFVLEAKNAADVTTQYYTGNYAIFDLTNWTNYFFELTSNNGATITASSINPSGNWMQGTANVAAGHRITRPANPVPPETIKISAQPRVTDGGQMVNSTRQEVFTISASKTSDPRFRYGRLAVTSAHGSELLPLFVPIEAQFWNGMGFVRNTDDSCTTIPLSSIAMKNYRGNLNACETQLSVASPMNSGILRMRLSAPGVTSTTPITPNTGSVDLEVNLGVAVATEKTCTSSTESPATNGAMNWFGSTDPIGRATFGIYKAPIIYMRENFGP